LALNSSFSISNSVFTDEILPIFCISILEMYLFATRARLVDSVSTSLNPSMVICDGLLKMSRGLFQYSLKSSLNKATKTAHKVIKADIIETINL
jgi:hypothetical protein